MLIKKGIIKVCVFNYNSRERARYSIGKSKTVVKNLMARLDVSHFINEMSDHD